MNGEVDPSFLMTRPMNVGWSSISEVTPVTALICSMMTSLVSLKVSKLVIVTSRPFG